MHLHIDCLGNLFPVKLIMQMKRNFRHHWEWHSHFKFMTGWDFFIAIFPLFQAPFNGYYLQINLKSYTNKNSRKSLYLFDSWFCVYIIKFIYVFPSSTWTKTQYISMPFHYSVLHNPFIKFETSRSVKHRCGTA